jgi:hypothetical protein
MEETTEKKAIRVFLKSIWNQLEVGTFTAEEAAYTLVDYFAHNYSGEYDPASDLEFTELFETALRVEVGPDYESEFTSLAAKFTELLSKYK